MLKNSPNRFVLMAGLLLTALAASARAALPLMESLDTTKHPNGFILLPVQGTIEGRDGYLLHCSTCKFSILPQAEPGKTLTSAQMVDQLRTDKTADLMYFPAGTGTLWAVSGKCQDLGALYLHEAAAQKLETPPEIPSDKTHPAGMINGVTEGHTYLVECTDGRYALVRAIQKTTVGLQIQYVYLSDGSLNFKVPQSELAEVTPLEPLTAVPTTRPSASANAAAAAVAPAAQPDPKDVTSVAGKSLKMGGRDESPTVLEPFLTSHIRQRNMLIKTRMAIVQSNARTPIDFEKKTDAIDELAQLRATESIDLLITQITFLNPRVKAKEFSPEVFHPCVAALIKLGKPASLAALKAIHDMKLEAVDVAVNDADGTQTPQYRAGLLNIVIRGVEGNAVAELLLKKDMESADETHKVLYRQTDQHTEVDPPASRVRPTSN